MEKWKKYEDWKANKRSRINVSYIIKTLGKGSEAVQKYIKKTGKIYYYHDYAYMLRSAEYYNGYPIIELNMIEDYIRSAIKIVDRNGATTYYLRLKENGTTQWVIAAKAPFQDECAHFMYVTYEQVKVGKKTKTVKRYNKMTIQQQFKAKKLLLCDFYRDAQYMPYYGNKFAPSKEILNTFTGYRAKYIRKKNRPTTGLTYNRYRKVIQHIKETVCNCNEAFYEYLLHWLAHLIRKSGVEKLRTMLVFVGKQGTGKNLIFEKFIMNGIIGKHYGNLVTDLARFCNNFNVERQAKSLHIFNEVSSIALGRQNSDKLKSLIDDWFMCEPKGKERFKARDCAGCIFLSNNDLPVKIEQGDRRYACVRMNDRYVGNRNHKYYDELVKAVYDDNVQNMFFSMLIDLNLSQWKMNQIPLTKHKTFMQENNIDHIVLQFFKTVIINNGNVPFGTWYLQNTTEPMFYTISEVEEGFVQYLSHKGIHKACVKLLGKVISRRVNKTVARPREKLRKVRTIPDTCTSLSPDDSDRSQCIEISKEIIKQLHREVLDNPLWEYE